MTLLNCVAAASLILSQRAPLRYPRLLAKLALFKDTPPDSVLPRILKCMRSTAS
jgi:hypothetical protein